MIYKWRLGIIIQQLQQLKAFYYIASFIHDENKMPNLIDTSIVNNQQKRRRVFLFTGVATIALGILYYILLRPLPIGLSWIVSWLSLNKPLSPLLPEYITQNWHYSIPSLLHILSFSFLTMAVVKHNIRNIYTTAIIWFLISIIFETSQSVSLIGTFDWFDIVAALLGAICFIVFTRHLTQKTDTEPRSLHTRPTIYKPSPLYLIPLFAIGIVSITGSYPQCYATDSNSGDCRPARQTHAEPIYMSFSELRSTAIFTDANSPLKSTGKIYLYNDYLFVNSPNQGIHIYDNRNPQSPSKVTYINIPGNVDIAISQGYLYVDSYIDLVTIDISNIQAPVVVNRQINIFPYDPYQNIPDWIYLENIDQSKGVVVGYTEI